MHGKGVSVYKEQIHVPMIISYPAYLGNKKCQALTCHLDIAPTLGCPEVCHKKNGTKKVLDNRKGINFSRLLKNPEGAIVNAVRNSSLYCYGMILYTDAHYLQRVIALQRDKQKTVVKTK